MKMFSRLDQRVGGLHGPLTSAQTPAAAESDRLQVGDWIASPATNELARDGRIVRIEPKAMEVLVVLAERAGSVISRDELLARVWPGVVVGEEALTQSIIKLRRALGDSARVPTYIQTISKRGYRLIAPVLEAEAPQPVSAPQGIAAAPSTATPQRMRLLTMVAGGAVTAGIVAWAVLDRSVFSPTIKESDVRARAVLDPQELPTVAILPFEPLSAEPEQRDLARALASDLTTDLSRLAAVRLIGVGGDATGPPPTARYVVSGTLQQDAQVLRINVRLTDTRTNELLWSERFERPYADLFAVQSEIGRIVSARLLGKLTEAEQRRVAKRYTNSLDAYSHFVRAQSLFLARRADANDEARASYLKALEADPKFARAYAGLAMTYAMESRYRQAADPVLLDRALELAESAREIDPEIPEIHWAVGFVHTQRRQHDKAIAALQQAIALNPSYADAYALMAGCYTYIGQPGRSIPLLRVAQRLNPQGGSLYFLLLGRAYLFENDLDQALINLREALARNADNLEARVYLTAALAASGDRKAAEWEVDQITTAQPGFSTREWLKTYPMTSARQQQRLVAWLASVRL